VGDAVRQLGIEIRAGLHTGEVEQIGPKVGGVAVHIGARVASQAAGSEVLVTRTVADLLSGSGIHFEDRGIRALKGIQGEWRLFAVDRQSAGAAAPAEPSPDPGTARRGPAEEPPARGVPAPPPASPEAATPLEPDPAGAAGDGASPAPADKEN
jgi:hypothetical protein